MFNQLKSIKLRNKIILLVLSMIMICLLMAGASYAYFSVTVQGTGNVTVIESGTLSLSLVDGDAISLDNALPGSKLTKTFSVTNTGTLDTSYDIYFSDVLNTFTDKTDLVYTLTSSNSTCTTTTETELPFKSTKLIDACNIASGKTQNFTLTILFKETNDNQDDNQGKRFQAKISVNEYKNVALLDTGENFNKILKTLAGDTDATTETSDTNITKITRVSSLPKNVTTSVVSLTDSVPIYAYYEAGTINLYSEADTYYLNGNASLMYSEMTKLSDNDISMLDSSLATNLSSMFYDCSSLISLDLSAFNTSNVTTIKSIFYGNTSLKTLNIDNFDINKIDNGFGQLLTGDTALELISMKNWKIGKSLSYFFKYSTDNSSSAMLDVTGWDLTETTNIAGLFYDCQAKEIRGLDTWQNTSNITDTSFMFQSANGVTSLDLHGLDFSGATTMQYMFYYSDVKNVDFSESKFAGNIERMFENTKNLTSVNLDNVDTSNVTNMEAMFQSSLSLTNIDLSSFDTSNITDMWGLFNGCTSLETVDLNNFDIKKMSTSKNDDNGLNSFFSGDYAIKYVSMKNWKIGSTLQYFLGTNRSGPDSSASLDLTGWNLVDTTNLSGLFMHNVSTNIIGLDTWDTSNITDMSNMFYGLSGIQSLDLSSWNTNNVTNMNGMFKGSSSLTNIDLSSFDTSKVVNMGSMFINSTNLKTIIVSNKFATTTVDTSSTSNYQEVFTGCTSLVGGNGTIYNVNNIDYTYARVDTSSTPGYFTLKS